MRVQRLDDDDRIVGYYNLTMGSVERADAPSRLIRGLPRFPVPIVLLARLAVDQGAQGQGLGMGLPTPEPPTGWLESIFWTRSRAAPRTEQPPAGVDEVGDPMPDAEQRGGPFDDLAAAGPS